MKICTAASLHQIGTAEHTADAVTRSGFTTAMRNVAGSVSVVTTDGQGGRHGGTVSSFCSVSADPPTMLICLNGSSRIANVVEANGCFNINVLAADATYIADRFAGLHDGQISDRFVGIDYALTGAGPALADSVVLACTVLETIQSGSHIIFTGLVHQVESAHSQPLIYLNGAYHQVVARAEEQNDND